MRVATSGDYAPFSRWPESAPEPEGFSVAVARAFAEASGRRIEWIRFDWPGLAADLAAARFDLALSGITIRPDRSVAGRFALPLVSTGAVALVSADSTLRGPTDLDRPAVRIAVHRGGHLERVARRLFPSARIEAIASNDRVPDRLADARADAVVTDGLEAPHWRSRLAPTRLIGPFTRDRKAPWLPADRAELARELDAWLVEAERSGTLGAMRRRHGLPDVATALPLPALLAKLDERLSLMPDVARAKRTLGRAIEDPAQEERVHRAARRAAESAARDHGVLPPDAKALWRFVETQLRAARFVQTQLAALPGTEAFPRDASASARSADDARALLETRLRPAIAHLSERCIWLAVAAMAEAERGSGSGEARPSLRSADVQAALADHGLPAPLVEEIRLALEALIHGRGGAGNREPEARSIKPRRESTAAPASRAGPARRAKAPSA
ncbi:MAG: transporter substrate-binding domain-containing protein [Myxococcota bacterium]